MNRSMINAVAGECNSAPGANARLRPGHRASATAGFTLIELLVVIAIIGILAALIFPVTAAVNRIKIKKVAQTELAKIESAIENYKSRTGSYPPDAASVTPGGGYAPPYINQLYYELIGTTFNGTTRIYTSKDGASTIPATTVKTQFGVDGFVNSSQGAGGDEGPRADNYFKTIKPNQIGTLGNGVQLLVCSVTWPGTGFPAYYPAGVAPLNPWRYVSSNPTNNPKSFDLWVDVIIGGKTNRISNWNTQPFLVSTP